jgi:tetratricopeptide (TPR) repeat protein
LSKYLKENDFREKMFFAIRFRRLHDLRTFCGEVSAEGKIVVRSVGPMILPPPSPPATGAEHEPAATANPYAMEGPFDCFKRPDIFEQLRFHPTTRSYAFDTGFIKSIEEVRTIKDDQALASRVLGDPRLTQTMGALQGWGLSVTEDELRKAERVGDMPKRDAVQFEDYRYANAYTTPLEAKEAGNRCFKDGENSRALACYLKVLQLIATAQPEGKASFEPSLPATVHANCAAVLLKLERPKDALASVAEAVRMAPVGFDLTKTHHRASLAHEALARTNLANVAAESAAQHWERALESARMALTAAKEAELIAVGGSSGSSGSSGGGGGGGNTAAATVRNMQREVGRLKDEAKAAKERREAVQAQAKREADAAARRAKGVDVSMPTDAHATDAFASSMAPAASAASSALVAREGRVGLPTTGYIRDIDLSPYAAEWLAREVAGLSHRWRRTEPSDKGIEGKVEGKVTITALELDKSEIHASIKEKRGKRSLFYDLSMQLKWSASSEAAGTSGEMYGVLKLYNVAQDTRFELGGDQETCYMYELGFPPQFHRADVPPWAARVREEAAELFEMVATLVTSRFVPAVQSKGQLVR